MKAPVGFQWLYNRLGRDFEMQFDLQPWLFEPHEMRLAPNDVARFLHHNSVVKVDLTTSSGVRALVPEGDKAFLVPYDEDGSDELIDRSKNDNPLGRGTGGVKTRAVKVPVG